MRPNLSMITNTMRTGIRTARSLRISRALTFSPGASIGGEASGARRDLLRGLLDQPDLALAECARPVRIDVQHPQHAALANDGSHDLRAGLEVVDDVAGSLAHVGNHLGSPGLGHRAAYPLSQRDAFVLGRLTAEGAQDQRVPVHEVDADPVERWLLLMEACYGSLDEFEIEVHARTVYRSGQTPLCARNHHGRHGGGCRKGDCPRVPLPAVAA